MSKRIRIVLLSALLVLSLVAAFAAGCTISKSPAQTVGQRGEVVQEAWDIISQHYVDKTKLDTMTLSGAAISGMVEALHDPYTTYIDPRKYQLSMSTLEGKFDGIGAYVGITKENQIIIISPTPNSPADKAGIRSGDIILEIDGQSTAGLSVQEAVLRVRGQRGTPVRLRIQHQGETISQEVTIFRTEIKITSIDFEMKDDIAYIKINNFAETTDKELLAVFDNVTQEATGIVLDLRGNPGGLLSAVVDVGSHFLKEGTFVSLVDNQGKKTATLVKTNVKKTDLPMVVLTDNYSASASEVLSGALQDYARATIAGKTTFGKGSVDAMYPLQDGSALYLTTGRWLTPKGRLIEGKGIEPDYKLEMEGDALIQWAINYLKGSK
jgi:carboxyl-terminal processing protease